MENGFLMIFINVMKWISDYGYITSFINYRICTIISFYIIFLIYLNE